MRRRRCRGASLALDDKMVALTRKPDADTSSLMEIWDATIRGQVAYQGPVYKSLFPQGRETFTRGNREEQLDALWDVDLLRRKMARWTPRTSYAEIEHRT